MKIAKGDLISIRDKFDNVVTCVYLGILDRGGKTFRAVASVGNKDIKLISEQAIKEKQLLISKKELSEARLESKYINFIKNTFQDENIVEIFKPKEASDFYLKPCPFCGCEEIIYIKYEHKSGKRWKVFCCKCSACIDVGYAQQKSVVRDFWNERAQNEK